jgi:GlpG protein
MRLLGTLPQETQARRLADYLLTLDISTHVTQEGSGWEVWVRDDDHVPRAKQEWEPFLANPDDPRFQQAQRAAQDIKRQEEAAEAQFRRNQRRASELLGGPRLTKTPLTIGIFVFCVLVAILSGLGQLDSPITQAFTFAKYRLIEENLVVDEGLNGIWEGELWRIWTPIFLHLGWIHLILNMMALLQLSRFVESQKGTLWLVGFILFTGAISNIGQHFFPHVFDIYRWFAVEQKDVRVFERFGGMSGVLFALFGYLWMKHRFDPESGIYLDRQNVYFMMIWLVLCMTGYLGSIANTAHVVGLLAGMGVGVSRWAWRRLRRRNGS